MKKKSFWKRCNRGFIVSMALLVAVLGYVTVTQVMLAGQKKEIRAITDQVQTLLTDVAKLPYADAQAMAADATKTAAYRDATKKKLAGLFVKDAAYLDEGTEHILSAADSVITDERTITSVESAKPMTTIRIDEDTAAVSVSKSCKVTGTWYGYEDNGGVPTLRERSGNMDTDWSASFVKENGAWKLYRISYANATVW